MNFNLNIKMAENSFKNTIKTSFRPKLSSLHIVYTPVIPFDNFTDVLGLFENYLICIFVNINIINYEKFGKSLKNKMYTYIITNVWHVNRPRMIKVVAA